MTNIDELTKRVNSLVAEIDDAVAKARHRVIVEHDDGDGGYYEDVSDPSLDASDDSDNDSNDLDDDEEDGAVRKDVVNPYLRERDRDNRPGALSSSTHAPNRHKFEALVDKIKNDQGIPKSQAMAYAREQYPEVYRSYQRHTNSVESTFKRAPTTFEGLVNAEMRKGVNSEVAAQRVAQLHGFRAFDQPSRIVKRRGDLLYTFQKRVDDIMHEDGVDATEATRRARQEDPRLFSAMQRAG
jgi:hypothetical protein